MRRIFKFILSLIWLFYAAVALWKFDWRALVLLTGASYLVRLYYSIPDDTIEEPDLERESCEGCRHNLGGGHCRINVEGECREGGGFELWEVKTMTANRYRYYCIKKPKSLGDLPSGSNLRKVKIFPERRYVAEIDRMAWAVVECETLLTPMEVSEYELVSAPLEVE